MKLNSAKQASDALFALLMVGASANVGFPYTQSSAADSAVCEAGVAKYGGDRDCSIVEVNNADHEYDLKPAFEGDIPTRESARRFYEWNPIREDGNGSKINAHIFKDAIEFNITTPKEKFLKPRNGYGSLRIAVINENSWSDFLAGFSNADKGRWFDLYITNNKDSLEPENLEIINNAIEEGEAILDSATIIGGTEAISDNIASELEEIGFKVERLGGKDRVETMANTFPSKDYFSNGFELTSQYINIVRGYAAPGASESGSYADTVNMDLIEGGTLLTTSEHLHPTTKNKLESGGLGFYGNNRGLFTIYGGTNAVSKNIEDELLSIEGLSPYDGQRYKARYVTRISGPTRYHTAIESAFGLTLDEKEHIPISNEVIIVDGEAADMFKTAYPIRVNYDRHPVLFVNGDEIPSVTADYLKDFGDPAKILPGNEHRRAICYASETACAKAREIMGITQ